MSTETLGPLTVALLLLVAGANVLGEVAARLRQPRVVGEILAGILLGPTLLGQLAPGAAEQLFGASAKDPAAVVLAFLYQLGLLLLMFISGASARNVLGPENRKPTAWFIGLGTTLPFLLALLVSPLLPLDPFMGAASSEPALVLVFAIAAAVTSIPVITKIFSDLGILHTRFASLLLGAAVLEDIALWGALALATAVASAATVGAAGSVVDEVLLHVMSNVLFVVLAMTVLPAGLRRLGHARWNVLASSTPIAWILVVLLAYVSVAAASDVTLAFAAFLAGFGIVGGLSGTEHGRFRLPLEQVGSVSSAVFIPVYFAMVGYRLDVSQGFSAAMLIGFLVVSSLVRLISVAAAAQLAGFRRLDVLNLAITFNARGGPGIVLASVALDAGIISTAFYTTLVITAVLTSQACGCWLDLVLRRGWPLLAADGPVVRSTAGPGPTTVPAIRTGPAQPHATA